MSRSAGVIFLCVAWYACSATVVMAQPSRDQRSQTPGLDLSNPISIVQSAGNALNDLANLNVASPDEVESPEEVGRVLRPAGVASPESVQPVAPDNTRGLSATLSILTLLTVLTIAPAILVMCTSFTRVVIVLSLVRQAIGTQSLPPSQVIVGLSLFMTFLIMAPTIDRINQEVIIPLQNNEVDQLTAWSRVKQPLRDFMFAQIDYGKNWGDVYMILEYRYGPKMIEEPENLTRQDVDMITLVPAYILSELKIAFLLGFKLYLPFLIIDMVVASVLISMGMLMLPPVLISLPFKLLLFVLVDGWRLVAGNLLGSFNVAGVG